MSSVILLSGGMDSAVLAANLKEKGKTQLYAISFDYGSKHNITELGYAETIADRYCEDHVIVRLPLNHICTSSLLKGGPAVPEGHYKDRIMKSTVVPFRNGIMISIAAGYAESIGADRVLLASHAGDHAIYPDCTSGFNEAMALAVLRGTDSKIMFESPYAWLTKREIGRRGYNIKFHFEMTYSCYKGGELHCGKCGACVERKEALEGFDPTIYQTK